MIASPDGADMVKKTLRSGRGDASSLGRRLAAELLSTGGDKILEDAS
jgi:porphobilinogen deaminase